MTDVMKMTVIGLATAALLGCGAGSSADTIPTSQRTPSVGDTVDDVLTCDRPRPSYPSGFDRLIQDLDPDVWGAGDVGLTVHMPPLKHRRTDVWVFADTLMPGGVMHHSTAWTQVGGCIRPTQGQLLPNVGDHFFWPRGGRRVPGTDRMIEVKARAVSDVAGPHNLFEGWQDEGYDRHAVLRLQDDGDVVFDHWEQIDGATNVTSPEPPPAYFEPAGEPDKFWYSFRRHWKLPDGRWLWTKCPGYSDGLLHGWPASRPVAEAHPDGWRPGE